MTRDPRRRAVRRALVVLAVATLATAALPPAGQPAGAASGDDSATAAPVPVDDLPSTPKFLGMTFDIGADHKHDTFAGDVGYHPRFRQLIRNIDHDDWDEVKASLDETACDGTETWLETQVQAGAGGVEAFLDGDFDAELDLMVAELKGWLDTPSSGGCADRDRHLIVAPFPEANLGLWGGDAADYRAAYEKVWHAFRDQGAGGIGPDQVRFAFAMNGAGPQGQTFDLYYPGEGVVDLLAFQRLNRADPDWLDPDEVLGEGIDRMYDLVSTTKPIVISQTGTVDGPQRDAWIDEAFKDLEKADQVIGFIYWSRLDGGAVPPDFDVTDGAGHPIDSFETAAERNKWRTPIRTTDWIFDGGMDGWVEDRTEVLYGDPGFDKASLRCHGLPVTLVGTIWNDDLTATPNADVIHVMRGRDTVEGLDGDDTICGSGGRDTLLGNDGDDWIDGGNGDDVIEGLNGDDRLFGRAGDDLLDGGTGDDIVRGGTGDDDLFGTGGADRLFGGFGVDVIEGGPDDDVIRGQPGSDDLRGDGGADVLIGGGDPDTMDGGGGPDVLKGGPGDDTMEGSAGNDILRGHDGSDVIDGKGGADRLFGGGGGDVLLGNLGDDQLRGQSGDDDVRGGAGIDWVHGGGGIDICFGEIRLSCEV
jgi:hypothetical protein